MKYIKIIVPVIIIALIAAYMFWAHHRIYQIIIKSGLGSVDKEGRYMINNEISPTKTIKYSALGDSLTSGVGAEKYEDSYPYLLAQKMSASGNQVDLRVHSYPGARTINVIKDQLEPAVADQPDIVTVLIGVNDLHGLVSEETFKKNYSEILGALKNKTRAEIYIINIPSIGTDSLLLAPYNSYYRHRTKAFNKIVMDLAAENGAKYIDLYSPTAEILKKGGPHYAADSFHPSAEGYKSWAQIIYDGLTR